MQEVPLRRRRRWLWLLPLLLLVGYGAFVGVRLFLFQPRLEPGPATTAVEGHLRFDGTVDYAAALDEEWSEGVTPENNAAVLLIEAFGPAAIPADGGNLLLDRLGVPAPQSGPFLLSVDEYFQQSDVEPTRRDVVSKALSLEGPLSSEEFPEVREWIERNEIPLQRVVEASNRTRFFLPLVVPSPNQRLLEARLDVLQRCREAARVLSARSRLRLGSGDVAGACDDALACHRLGRLAGQSCTMIGFLVGVAIESVATEITEMIVLSGEVGPDDAKRLREGLDALPPMADVARTIDRGERLVSLDAVLGVVKGTSGPAAASGIPAGAGGAVDPNVMLQRFNAFYDEFVAALRIEDYADRKARLEALDQKHFATGSSRPSIGAIAIAALTGSRAALTNHISDVLVKLLFPAVKQAQVAEDRTVMRLRLARVGAALAEYRAAQGEFPEELEQLRPRYLDDIPSDFYSNGPLRYRRIEGGFVLHSVGQDGQDDGGVSFGECEGSAENCDDIRFGIAPAKAVVP